MHSSRKNEKFEKSALRISLTGNLIFVILELAVAIYTSSQAVLLDSVYDGVELLMIFVSIILVPLLYKPSNENHPFGYLQVETLFVVVKGIIMTAVTAGLIINNIQIIIHGGRHVSFSVIAWFELAAAILSVIFIAILSYMNRHLSSPVVTMEIQEWKIDTAASLGMTVAFFLPMFLHADWFRPIVPYLDQCIAIILSICMLPTPIHAVVTRPFGISSFFLPKKKPYRTSRTLLRRFWMPTAMTNCISTLSVPAEALDQCLYYLRP